MGFILPFIRKVQSMGTRVIAMTTDDPIAIVFVQASGVKSFPSCPVSPNTGKNIQMVVKAAKNIEPPTSFDASRMICGLLFLPFCSMRFLKIFSVMMMLISLTSPMAMAIPVRDIMFESIPIKYMHRKEIRIDMGNPRQQINILRTCNKNIATTIEVIMISSISASLRVSITRLIRPSLS